MDAAQLIDTENLDGIGVLVVEDDYFVANDLAAQLKGHKARVIGPVPDVASAREILLAEPPDCVLLDINLKGRFAFDLAEELVKRGQAVIFITGYDASFLPPHLRDTTCLQKPVDIHAVARAIRRETGKPRAA